MPSRASEVKGAAVPGFAARRGAGAIWIAERGPAPLGVAQGLPPLGFVAGACLRPLCRRCPAPLGFHFRVFTALCPQ